MASIALPEPREEIIARREEIGRELKRLVVSDGVITDEAGRRAYETDAFTAYRRIPLAVVLPETTQEVSRILSYCNVLAS